MTKQAYGLRGNEKPKQPFAFLDVSDAVGAASNILPVLENYHGTAMIVGYMVLYSGDTPTRAIAIADTPASERVVVYSEEPLVVQRMLGDEMWQHHRRRWAILHTGGASSADLSWRNHTLSLDTFSQPLRSICFCTAGNVSVVVGHICTCLFPLVSTLALA
ncbi:MAG: hypothetical protein IPK95_05190 [Cellvibrionales bacterium]|nr:hypothetical protein [Cellvibrionales bacterium]